MRAILLAGATATSLGGLRRSRSSSQADDFLLLPSRTRRRRAVAPTIRVLRKASSPARVMTPSHLAGRRVVLRCQPKPCCELAPGSEQARIGRLHDQHRGADLPDAWDLRE